MSYENLMPGSYEATLSDWGLQLNKFGNAEACLVFEFDHNGQHHSMKYRRGILNKAGEPNGNLMKALKTCDFKSSDIQDLNLQTALNNQKKYSIDIGKNEKGFWDINWVNPVGVQAMDKVAAKKTLAGVDFSKFNGALMQEGFEKPKVVKNYAPGADSGDDDINEEMGF